MNYSVIIPAFNEAESLPLLFKELKPVLQKLKTSYQVIVVDDGSLDNTFELVKQHRATWPQLMGVKLRQNQGKSAALITGFHHAQGQIVITIDADLQDDPRDIVKLLSKLNQGWDVVSGWRSTRKDTLTKQISTKLFNWLVAISTGLKLHDFNCGLKVYRQTVVKNVEIVNGMHRFLPVLAAWQGFRVTELPVTNRARRFGRSKYGFERILKSLIDLSTIIFLHKYAQHPLRLFGTIGVSFFVAGFSAGIYLAYLRLQGFKIGDRPLLILAVLLMVLGAQFFSLGLLGEMIASRKPKLISTPEVIE